jgi:hypothetical protein
MNEDVFTVSYGLRVNKQFSTEHITQTKQKQMTTIQQMKKTCGVGVRTNKHDRQCTYKRNTEGLSRNHCCPGKVISIKYTEYVCVCVCVCVCARARARACVCVCSIRYPACKAHAPFVLSSVVCLALP